MKEESKTIIAYKGFDKDLQCRGFQYKIGEEYELPKGEFPKACENGFHACENPADLFAFYSPNEGNRYCLVELSGVIDSSRAKKTCASRIKIIRELTIKEVVEARIEYAKEHIIYFDTGHFGASTATDDYGSSTVTGHFGASSATGNYGASSATGYRGASTATGYRGASSATGNYGASTATGYRGASSATSNYGASSATGDYGASTATGDYGTSSATGNYGASTATGNYGTSVATGNCGASTATGNYGASSAGGLDSIALAAGYQCKAKGSLGCWLVIAEREKYDYEKRTYPIKDVKAVKVDGTKIKSDTWYMLVDGELVEVDEVDE